MKNVALFFGSYNPCHYTHIKIAEFISKLNYIDEVQLVVSPQNPFKHDLADYNDRYNISVVYEMAPFSHTVKGNDGVYMMVTDSVVPQYLFNGA